MKSLALRTRVVLSSIVLLAVVLLVVMTTVTLLYRQTLDRDVRQNLLGAAETMAAAWPHGDPKQLAAALARQGIATDILTGPAAQPGGSSGGATSLVSPGNVIARSGASLLVLHQTLPDGTQITYSASLERSNSSAKQLLEIEAAVYLAALVSAIALLGRTTRRALRPLISVAGTARRIADGDRAERLMPQRTDTELGGMAAAFDQMVDALEAAVVRSERAEAAMRAFLADASHELRTPVAALQAVSETLLREQPARPERDVLEASIAREAVRLGRLIDDLLDLTRSESLGHVELVDVAAVANRVVADGRLRHPMAQINLDTCGSTVVKGDPSAIERTLRNILDNALAAAPSNGIVEIRAHLVGSFVDVTVTDNGPGVPDSERERIFDRFVRLSQTTRGHGLGLAIARRIALLHGGDLLCNSCTAGASFTLRLPPAVLSQIQAPWSHPSRAEPISGS